MAPAPVRTIRFTLTQKLIASFALIGVCLIGALVYTILGLGTMHRMVGDIARNDLPAAIEALTLLDALQAQQRSAGRYQILKQPEFKDNFIRQSDDFRKLVSSLIRKDGGEEPSNLLRVHMSYNMLVERMFSGHEVSESSLRQAAKQVEAAIEALRASQQKRLENKLEAASEKESHTTSLALGLALSGVSLAIVIAFLLVYTFSSSIGKLQKATHRIAAGEFDHDPHIPPGDEIGALSQDFLRMAARLKELEQISLDASPLTRLPGNIAIERSINRRIREQASFAMCYLDLDNFKAYNDRYGYIKASDVLKKTGEVIHETVKQLNDPDAFVGHIGGDDFVVIIDSRLAKTACQKIIAAFDALVPQVYTDEDLAAGAIKGVDRYGVERVFPLLSMSIAALNCQPGHYASASEIASAAAAVKDRVKESSGSNYIIVREAGSRES